MHLSEVERACFDVLRGNTNCNNGNSFLVKWGGRAARRQQWWGNKLVGLVLEVHMGKIDSYANYTITTCSNWEHQQYAKDAFTGKAGLQDKAVGLV